MFERSQAGHAADAQGAIRVDLDLPVLAFELPQADQPRGPKHAGLHHEHDGRAAAHGTDIGIFGVEQADRLVKRAGGEVFEWDHSGSPCVLLRRVWPRRACESSSRRSSVAMMTRGVSTGVRWQASGMTVSVEP